MILLLQEKVDPKIIYVIVFLPYDGKRKLADEQAVLDKVMAQQQVNSTVDYGLVEGKKRTIGKRLEEIDKVISRLHEDYALGTLAGTSIDNLLPKYQREQEDLYIPTLMIYLY